MLCLNDVAMGRKRFYNLSRGHQISAFKHCRNVKGTTYVHLTLVSKYNIIVTVK